MEYNFQNTYADMHIVHEAHTSLLPYIADIKEKLKDGYKHPEGFLNCAFDIDAVKIVEKTAAEKGNKRISAIVVIGMGGSSAGAQAVYELLRGKDMPQMVFINTLHPRAISDLEYLIEHNITDPEEILIYVASHSGTTTETITAAASALDFMQERFDGEVHGRFVVATSEGSPLWRAAQTKDMTCIALPPVVGRLSVFSPAGLFPLAVAGIDIRSFLKGGEDAFHAEFAADSCVTHAAAIGYAHATHGRTTANMVFFDSRFRALGEWRAQLLAESLGKEPVGGEAVGITPLTSLAPKDFHSTLQLFLEGPDTVYTVFVKAPKGQSPIIVSNIFSDIRPEIIGKRGEYVMEAIVESVQNAYKERERPFAQIAFSALSSHELGYFMQSQMLETILCARMLGVNAFDQPAVDSYKEETQRRLEE